MWRVVGVRVGLSRHDMEVEGVVVKDDAVLELRVRCCTCKQQVLIVAKSPLPHHSHQLSLAEPPPLPPQKGAGFRCLLAYCFVSGLGLRDLLVRSL